MNNVMLLMVKGVAIKKASRAGFYFDFDDTPVISFICHMHILGGQGVSVIKGW